MPALIDTPRLSRKQPNEPRASFGFRWSMRGLPPVLKELMRHKDIATTMKYYVGRNAELTADAVWEAVSQSNCGKEIQAAVL